MSRSLDNSIDWREILAMDLKNDAEFRAEWERTAPARALANVVIRYRSDHDLTQTGLGRQIGMSQPAIARLEIAEHVPTIETLIKLSNALGVGFRIEIHPRNLERGAKPEMVDLPTDIEVDLNFVQNDEQLRSAAD